MYGITSTAKDAPVREDVELVAAAVFKHSCFKRVFVALVNRPPDRDAAALLIEAYDWGDAPLGLTAYLLGQIRHDLGYSVAKSILRASHGLGSESYAEVAMAKIRGENALPDLKALLFKGSTRHILEGAACGLSQLSSEAAFDSLVDACITGHVSHRVAGWIVLEMPGLSLARIMPILASRAGRVAMFATEVIWAIIAHEQQEGGCFDELRAELEDLVR